MEAEKYSEAGKRLDDLLQQTTAGSYERAVVQQTIGYLYTSQDQYNKAAQAFQQALDLNALPDKVAHNLRYNLAQLLIADGQYQKGISLMENWLSAESKPQNNVYVLLASAYYRIDNHSKVIEHISTAIKNDTDPKEDWYRMLLSAHISLKQFKSAINVLETLITRYPYQKAYWDQLSSLYLQQNKEVRALAVRMLADRLDLGDAKTLLSLADMYRYLHIPYKAAQLLQKAMNDGVIAADFANLQRLADSWLAAREPEQAAGTLQKMLAQDNSGGSHLKLGQVYAGMEQWDKAVAPLTDSLKLLNGSDLGKAHILLGTANFHLDNLQQAKAHFSKAISFEAQSRQASQWLRHIEDQLREKEDEKTS
jgi:tetratricopeptide (TPR) repeat protein